MTQAERVRVQVIAAINRRSRHHDGVFTITDSAAVGLMTDLEDIISRVIARGAEPLSDVCAGCNAEPGEPCRPMCTGYGEHLDQLEAAQ